MYGVFTKGDKGIQYLDIPGGQSIPCSITVSQVLKEGWVMGAEGLARDTDQNGHAMAF